MRAFQCHWSAPRLACRRPAIGVTGAAAPEYGDAAFAVPDYQLLATALSALKWRQLNGPIRLYADPESFGFYDRLGLAELWDEIDTEVIAQIDLGRVDPRVFWSAGKILACAAEPAPCVHLDLDLIVWHNIDAYYDVPLRFAYWESADRSRWYSDPRELAVPEGYQFRDDWEHMPLLAANTALLFFGDANVKSVYVREAFRFMCGNPAPANGAVTPEMLFADQRILPLCAFELGVPMAPFVDMVWYPAREWRREGETVWFAPFEVNQEQLFSHVWCHKQFLEERRDARTEYCAQMARVIADDFPGVVPLLARVDVLQPYFAA